MAHRLSRRKRRSKLHQWCIGLLVWEPISSRASLSALMDRVGLWLGSQFDSRRIQARSEANAVQGHRKAGMRSSCCLIWADLQSERRRKRCVSKGDRQFWRADGEAGSYISTGEWTASLLDDKVWLPERPMFSMWTSTENLIEAHTEIVTL